jgi:DNA modification methylase
MSRTRPTRAKNENGRSSPSSTLLHSSGSLPGLAGEQQPPTTFWSGSLNSAHWEVHCGDAKEVLKSLTARRFSCAVTSPPYFWQRDYNVDGQIGKEASVKGYVKAIADTMDEVKRVLRDDAVLFLNLGDTYYSAKGKPKGDDRKNKARRFGLRAVDTSGLGVPRKTAIGIPWRVALEMISRNWILRAPIVWRREKSLPEPTAHDRPWRTYELVFLFSKTPRYHFDRSALKGSEDVWTISTRPRGNNGLHSAAFPDALVEKCLASGCKGGGEVLDEVLDPFAGTGTVLRVASELGHPSVGIDISQDFCRYMVEQLGPKTKGRHAHLD